MVWYLVKAQGKLYLLPLLGLKLTFIYESNEAESRVIFCLVV
jgi:hypothetical protein